MPRKPSLLHRVKIALRRLVVDHGNPAARRRPRAFMPKRVAELSVAVHARGDDDHPLHVQRLVQCCHLPRAKAGSGV